jgi:hypothetical protein
MATLNSTNPVGSSGINTVKHTFYPAKKNTCTGLVATMFFTIHIPLLHNFCNAYFLIRRYTCTHQKNITISALPGILSKLGKVLFTTPPVGAIAIMQSTIPYCYYIVRNKRKIIFVNQQHLVYLLIKNHTNTNTKNYFHP